MFKEFIKKRLPLIVLLAALGLLIFSMASNNAVGDTGKVADKVAQKLTKRLERLDSYVSQATENDSEDFLCLEKLPEDMVIYVYVNDSLKSWNNQFSILNDDISRRLVFNRLEYFNSRLVSPLTNVTDTISYMNLGSKWYVVKSVNGRNNTKVIAGLEIKNNLIDDLGRTENGVNRQLRLSKRYSVVSMMNSGGSPVEVNGIPLFKVIYDTGQTASFFDNSFIRWIALLLLAVAMILFLYAHRSIKTYVIVLCALSALTVVAYIWEIQLNGTTALFSPTLYADGTVFFSLGSLLLINMFITTVHMCSYMVRNEIYEKLCSDRKKRKRRLCLMIATATVSTVLTFVYTHLTLRSLIMNSNISLELYRGNDMIQYTALVYMSYTALLFCLILIIQTIRPAVRELLSFRYDMFRTRNLIIYAFICSIYFTVTAASLGFVKEQDRIMVWANRLAVERDLGLEIQLRSVEEPIASDQLIASLAEMGNTQNMILNRISEYHMPRARQGYNMTVYLFDDEDRLGLSYFNDILRTGTPIAQGSNFLFLTDSNGRSRYAGTFAFYSKEKGLTRMLLEIEPQSNREDLGYYSILGQFSNPGNINIPAIYSYAKYNADRLISYKGNYPYPTVYADEDKGNLEEDNEEIIRINGHVHFLHIVGDDELIIISRPQRGILVYFTSFSYLCLILCALLHLLARSGSRKENFKGEYFKSNYFKTRINTILFVSSFMILASMTAVSVLFVYKRNEKNMHNLMSTKISTIQALTENRIRTARSYQDLMGQDFAAALENIGNTTKSDITLYSPEGKVFLSTTPEVFEKIILGSRIDQNAFHSIRHENHRFFIHKEKIDSYSYWSMYAPIFNDNGELIAIISSPYTDRNYDFQREAFFHAALIINLFILLLISSLLFSTREVKALFSPLIEMGKKMNVADVHNLEYIIYKRDDEISSLVDAYNRMVHDLSDSTRQLAQAERDKAWSQMARQVAHEIKNPLTPIKLQIQRLIRMKQNNNPNWEERFDEVSSVVLEHIDILTETANEFSTFAKLYSEEPVLIDLDKTLKDQIMIFDNKENIRIQYIGLSEAYVMAPKPQLIRVFVNLLTNAVQAVEIQQREAEDSGREPEKGRILICLRNSIKDGCYDIVFDDSGPGVKEENLDRLFTPNFTTKTGGTGLGLAICRNIIEKCDGEIGYRKSFVLGGASFTVTLPKHQA